MPLGQANLGLYFFQLQFALFIVNSLLQNFIIKYSLSNGMFELWCDVCL